MLKITDQICYYGCGQKATHYFKTADKWCCENNFHKCPERRKQKSIFMKKKMIEYYENNNNYYKGKSRPLHSKKLLQPNEFGGKGNYGWYHARAHELFGKDKCEVCGKINKEELEYCKKGLIMHCKSDNWTDLSDENWKCVCSKCHKKIHKNLRRFKNNEIM